MMKGNVYTVNDIKEKLLPVFKKHNIKKAILFGSYAKGSADNRSDIDIMVDSNLRGLAFYGLLEDVVNTIGKSVDLLDKQQIKAESKVGQSLQEFEADSMRVEACVFNLMQIGELAKTSLSDNAKAEITSIPWNQLYGMRNRIVHDYDGVAMTIVWDTINCDLPALIKEIEKYL